MTRVRFALGRYLPDGAAAAYGTVRCAPDRRIMDDKRIMLPTPFDARLDEQGEAVVELEPTREQFAWIITILPTRGEPFGRTVEVPDTTATMDYTDLLDTDPTTLVPPALTLGELMRVHWAKSDDEAFEYSRTHPDELVLYQEEGA